MNENINLCEILEDCEGVKLYSPLCGECALYDIGGDVLTPICVECYSRNGRKFIYFDTNGRYFDTGEVLLFPSKDQRDWSKFEKPRRFPKTYEEARLKFNEDILQCIDEELRDLFKLIVIRDAWWEADNNWRPDWNDYATKFALMNHEDTIMPDATISRNRILSFQTPELRDRFLETHRNLIEKCKNYI